MCKVFFHSTFLFYFVKDFFDKINSLSYSSNESKLFKMSIHISATKGQIAETVLLPGDPLRAKWIAKII